MSEHRELTLPLPVGACDSQVHVFGGPYPLSEFRRYEPPPESGLADMLRMHASLGVTRGVVVQASAQGWETRYVADVLRQVPHYRGVVLMNDRLTDRDLRDLHDAGVRGGRLVFLKGYDVSTDPATIERSMRRMAEMGWFAKIFVTGNDWIELRGILDRITLPVVIDHLGFLDPAGGADQPAARVIIDLLRRDNWWMMLSNGNRLSKLATRDDVVPLARAYIEAAPERVVWGSDWPHVAHDPPLPAAEEIIALLFRYAPDARQRERILVTNPARLFDFPPLPAAAPR